MFASDGVPRSILSDQLSYFRDLHQRATQTCVKQHCFQQKNNCQEIHNFYEDFFDQYLLCLFVFIIACRCKSTPTPSWSKASLIACRERVVSATDGGARTPNPSGAPRMGCAGLWRLFRLQCLHNAASDARRKTLFLIACGMFLGMEEHPQDHHHYRYLPQHRWGWNLLFS